MVKGSCTVHIVVFIRDYGRIRKQTNRPQAPQWAFKTNLCNNPDWLKVHGEMVVTMDE